MEHEQRQLHQVIAQLRQARKSNREDADSLVAERDALRRDADLLHSENANIKFSLAEKQQEAEVLTRRLYELSTSFDQLSSELSRLRDENKSLFEKYDERDSRCKQLTKALFDAESKLELLQSDLAMMKQDLDFKSTEVQNLNLAIDGLEKESDRRIASANVDFEARLERLSKEHHNNVLALERSLMQQVSNLQASLAESKQREVDEGLLRRKAEMEWVAERKRLQTAVESAMRKLQNSSEDVVDRAVVANLIVSYFRKRK
jgi:chromosome segregation ATPase